MIVGVGATVGDTMAHLLPGPRARRGLPAVVLVLATLLTVGCSGVPSPRRAGPTASASVSSPVSSPASSALPSSASPSSALPSSTVSASATPPPTARPARETVGPASPRQLVGLVRIVVSIGDAGRGETSTGMLISSDGDVVTSDHGVVGATAAQATVMTTGRTYAAHVVAEDARHDVALLRLDDASGLAAVALAPRAAAVGAPVTVVGDAHGLRSTFTAATGVVLAIDQTLVAAPTATTRGERLTGLLLGSADVVSGDSGGPTYDGNGRVVGLTTASVHVGSGLAGVAIPVDTLRHLVADLVRAAG